MRQTPEKTLGQCWTFLGHDGVPWNNSNAEFAIKAFAQHRYSANGIVSPKGLTEYLSTLSISQTCRYQNISLLDLLRKQVAI